MWGTGADVHRDVHRCQIHEGFNQQSVNRLYEYVGGGNMTYDPNKKTDFLLQLSQSTLPNRRGRKRPVTAALWSRWFSTSEKISEK
ncbi:MAG: hypothetical protein IPJ13_10540 [Saprospiraceae bacterium]|nr:hypothetical protein [Saprospiraceae bacterium]